jgi:predicted RNA-binding protein with PUA-like domain
MSRHWLVKTEPTTYSMADLQRDGRTGWEGVRNYQARNFMRDEMKPGDRVLIYHSSADPTGVAGLARVRAAGVPDPSQFNRRSEAFDPASTRESPRWFMAELEFERLFDRVVTLDQLRAEPSLAGMGVLRRGNRLSVMPVTPEEYRAVVALAGRKARA